MFNQNEEALRHFPNCNVGLSNVLAMPKFDSEKVEGRELEDNWDFLPPKVIKDPNLSKLADWVDAAKPDHFTYPDATKSKDWDGRVTGYSSPWRWSDRVLYPVEMEKTEYLCWWTWSNFTLISVDLE